MAFTTATGYGNLPNGNFSPVIYSKKVQLAFRKSTVCGDITNSDYFGEIAAQGDTVKIIKEPEISVSEYARGTNVTAQDLQDEDFSLVVDKANYFAFKMDDIEEAHMRNRQLVAAWAYEKGKSENVIEKVVKEGKTYFVIRDYAKLRILFGDLLPTAIKTIWLSWIISPFLTLSKWKDISETFLWVRI